MLPIARIFGFSLQTPLLAALVGVALAIQLAQRLAILRGLEGNAVGSALGNGIFAFAIGARLGYVVVNLSSYLKDPLGALALNTTAMLPWVGWLIAAGFLVWRLHHQRALVNELAYILIPSACVVGMGLTLADLLSGNNFGTPATVPWAIDLWGALRYPVQAYEFLMWGLILMALLWLNARHTSLLTFFWISVALIAFGRVWVDGFRAEVLLLLGLRVTQLVGVFVTLIALWRLGEALKPSDALRKSSPEVQ